MKANLRKKQMKIYTNACRKARKREYFSMHSMRSALPDTKSRKKY